MAVDLDLHDPAVGLLVAGDVGQLQQCLHFLQQDRRPVVELVTVHIDEGVLVLGLREPRADCDVLRRLHIQGNAPDRLQRLVQARNHLVGSSGPLAERLQRDEHAPVVLGDGRPSGSDIAVCRSNRRVLCHHLQDSLRALLHRLRRDVLRALGDADDQAGVLLREEAFGDFFEQDDGRSDGRDHYHQRDQAMAQRHDQRLIVDGDQPVKEALEGVRDRSGTPLTLGRQETGAHHRRQSQRDDHRDDDRDGDGHRELPEQQTHDAAHQEQRNEHRNQRYRDRQDRKADLARPLQGSLHRRLPLLDVPDDVLDHDNRIVDDKADGDRQRHQREIVETEAEHIHHRESADQRHRHRHSGDHRRPQFVQEEEDHANYQRNRQQQGILNIGHTGADGRGAVRNGMDLDRRRQRSFQLRQRFLDLVNRRDHIRGRLALNRQQDRRLGVIPAC